MTDPQASRLHPQVYEILAYARAEGLDPVSLVFDFFREKDSRITKEECRRIVERYGTITIQSQEGERNG